jgi:hypothetical protein
MMAAVLLSASTLVFPIHLMIPGVEVEKCPQWGRHPVMPCGSVWMTYPQYFILGLPPLPVRFGTVEDCPDRKNCTKLYEVKILF